MEGQKKDVLPGWSFLVPEKVNLLNGTALR